MAKPNTFEAVLFLVRRARDHWTAFERTSPSSRPFVPLEQAGAGQEDALLIGRYGTNWHWQDPQRRSEGWEIAQLEASSALMPDFPGISFSGPLLGAFVLVAARTEVPNRREAWRLWLALDGHPGVGWKSRGAEPPSRRSHFLHRFEAAISELGGWSESRGPTGKELRRVASDERDSCDSTANRILWPDHLPLIADEGELDAIVGLRCLQQRHESAEEQAHQALSRHVEDELRKRLPGPADPHVVAEVIEDLAGFNAGRPRFPIAKPGALGAYAQRRYRALLSRHRGAGLDPTAPTASGSPSVVSVPEAAGIVSASRLRARGRGGDRRARRGTDNLEPSTIYRWIREGRLEPVSRRPTRVRLDEVERLALDLVGVVMELRRCSYDAARVWVSRRRAKGMGEVDILLQARRQ